MNPGVENLCIDERAALNRLLFMKIESEIVENVENSVFIRNRRWKTSLRGAPPFPKARLDARKNEGATYLEGDIESASELAFHNNIQAFRYESDTFSQPYSPLFMTRLPIPTPRTGQTKKRVGTGVEFQHFQLRFPENS